MLAPKKCIVLTPKKYNINTYKSRRKSNELSKNVARTVQVELNWNNRTVIRSILKPVYIQIN